jgi:hypothetical protein
VLDSERQRQKQPGFGVCVECRFYRSSPDYCMKFEQQLSAADMKLICVEQLDR